MNEKDLSKIRHGAEIQQFKPYLDNEIVAMQRGVVSSVLSAVNTGTLTPEMALSKWMEYIAYLKLTQRLDQKVRIGQSVGEKVGEKLDFSAQPTYKHQ